MRYFISFLSLFWLTCQYPVNQSELPDTQKFLVIDGEVTEDFVRVNVSYSLDRVTSNGAYTLPKPPTVNAVILDGTGLRYPLKNTVGVRDTAFKAKVGITYQLVVEFNGLRYESTKEVLRPCPELDSLIVEYNRESFRTIE